MAAAWLTRMTERTSPGSASSRPMTRRARASTSLKLSPPGAHTEASPIQLSNRARSPSMTSAKTFPSHSPHAISRRSASFSTGSLRWLARMAAVSAERT